MVFQRQSVGSVRGVGHNRGLTLIELLVALAVVSVLAAIGVPSFQEQLQASRVKAQAQRLMSAVVTARTLALSAGETATLCPWSDQDSTCAGNYSDGFAVLDETGAIQQVFASRSGITVLNRSGTSPVTALVNWNARGIGDRNLTLSVCSKRTSTNWALVLNRVGRPRLARDWGVCPG